MNAAYSQGAHTSGNMFNMEGVMNYPTVLGTGTLRQAGVATGGYTGFNSGTATGPIMSQSRDITLNMPMPPMLQNLKKHKKKKNFFKKAGRDIRHATKVTGRVVKRQAPKVAKTIGKGTVAVGKYAINHPDTILKGVLAGAACAATPVSGGATGPGCATASMAVAAQVGNDLQASSDAKLQKKMAKVQQQYQQMQQQQPEMQQQQNGEQYPQMQQEQLQQQQYAEQYPQMQQQQYVEQYPQMQQQQYGGQYPQMYQLQMPQQQMHQQQYGGQYPQMQQQYGGQYTQMYQQPMQQQQVLQQQYGGQYPQMYQQQMPQQQQFGNQYPLMYQQQMPQQQMPQQQMPQQQMPQQQMQQQQMPQEQQSGQYQQNVLLI